MEDQLLRVTVDARGVARLTLHRPDLRNAFNEQLIGEICDAMGQLNSDKAVRMIVVTGSGSAFCSGEDLAMMRRLADYSDTENKDDARRLAHMLRSIYDCEKPVIARVNGPAIGGAVGIVAACDIAIAGESAFFGLPEVRFGLVPAVISPFIIRAIGPRAARRYFMTGEQFSADEAKHLGLLHMVAMDAQLDATVNGVIDNLLQGGPVAQIAAKDLIRKVAYRPIGDAVMEEAAGLNAKARSSAEGREGLTAHSQRRAPSWAAAFDVD